MYQERSYRRWVKSDDLITFEVIEKETDLLISARRDLSGFARESILNHRGAIEDYIKAHPQFFSSLTPIAIDFDVPGIIKTMGEAGRSAKVGPMAAVAGAVAEYVGRNLLSRTDEVIVENGGDIFIKISKPRKMGIFAGDDSPFTGKLAIELPLSDNGYGVCTSSGTVSHSLNFGKADAILVISDNTALADAAATAIGNRIASDDDIEKAITFGKGISGIDAILVLVGKKMGSWGNIKLI